MTQHGSFPGRPRGRRARPDNDVSGWESPDSAPPDHREFPDLEPIRGRWATEADNGLPGRHGTQQPGSRPSAPVHRAPAPGAPQGDGQPGRTRQARTRQAQERQGAWDDDGKDDPMAAFSERWARRGAETPEDRRGSHRLVIIGSGVLAVVVAVVVYFAVGGSGKAGNVGLGSLITSFLPGEIQSVPNSCDAVTTTTLNQYLQGGKPKVAAPPLDGGQDSQCTWTLDAAPTYRVIEVDIHAYSPSGLASGNGSATFAAIDAYAGDEQVKENPGPRSGQPKATITSISGLGNAAFGSMQVFRTGGGVTDVATVIARYRNVLVTAVVNGLDHSATGKYGPVSQSTLSAAAQAAARDSLAKITS